MADLIIGGNTYQNIGYVKFKNTDGTSATFVEKGLQNNGVPTASFVSAVLGGVGIRAFVGEAIVTKTSFPKIQANLIFEGE